MGRPDTSVPQSMPFELHPRRSQGGLDGIPHARPHKTYQDILEGTYDPEPLAIDIDRPEDPGLVPDAEAGGLDLEFELEQLIEAELALLG
eukprot:14559043-Alexandrium_andersonii.AAC.1